MPASKTAIRITSRFPVPWVKVWLACEGRYVFGPGICQILQPVDRSGSIKQAAGEVGESYRHVWARIKEAERAGGCPLVETLLGGPGSSRSSLTDHARRVVCGFLAFRSRMARLAEREFARRFHFSKKPSTHAR
jgi:molybdate transport repressor ModE-like protein